MIEGGTIFVKGHHGHSISLGLFIGPGLVSEAYLSSACRDAWCRITEGYISGSAGMHGAE